MTRTDVMASSRPRAVTAASMRMGSSGASRRFLAIPAALLLVAALAVPTAAFAAGTSGESGYSQTPTEPKTTTTTTTTTTPKSGTSPSKEVSPSTAATTPAKTSTTATSTTKTETAKALPFTGLDLRWIVAAGILMMGAGLSIVTVQRRQRRGDPGR